MRCYEIMFKAERVYYIDADNVESATDTAWDSLKQDLNDINPLKMFDLESCEDVTEDKNQNV